MKDCRDCKWYESLSESEGFCLKEDAEISNPKENYCND